MEVSTSFANDVSIKSFRDDKLNRSKFVKNITSALINTSCEESVVLSINGEWGSGKTSIINLIDEEIKKNNNFKQIDFYYFNSWQFSGRNNLNEHFYNELSKQLHKQNIGNNKLISKKLKLYSDLLNLKPLQTTFKDLTNQLLILFGILGISGNSILQSFSLSMDNLKKILIIGGVLLIVVSILRTIFGNLSKIFQTKADISSLSLYDVKEELKELLINRKKKLVIVIDDLDRISKDEIKTIFKLIKINTDLPNIIYLLSFDSAIVEKMLDEPPVKGHDYIKKIVQISHYVPLVKEGKIFEILFKGINEELKVVENSKNFNFDQSYWTNVFHSGFKNYFGNIRDIKRYLNSVKLNISLIVNNGVIEVNLIDFLFIELMRVFDPMFYLFISNNKELFTSFKYESSFSQKDYSEERKNEIGKAMSESNSDITKTHLKDLLSKIFPQIYQNYSNSFLRDFDKQLRIASENYFEKYFVLNPEDDDKHISEYEMLLFFDNQGNCEKLEEIFSKYISIGKIHGLLEKLQSYTDDPKYIEDKNIENIILSLFNISELIPERDESFFSFGSSLNNIRIIYQLLSRNKEKELNTNMLINAIKNTVGLSSCVTFVNFQKEYIEKKDINSIVIEETRINELINVTKLKIINDLNNKSLIKRKKFIFILFRLLEWDSSSIEKIKEYFLYLVNDKNNIADLLHLFSQKSKSFALGDYSYKENLKINFKSLEKFIDLNIFKEKLAEIEFAKLSEEFIIRNEFIKHFDDYKSGKYGDW